jgi:hypothetical protein
MARTGQADHVVEGPGASGTAIVGNPILIGGSDGVNAQPLSISASGVMKITAGGPGAGQSIKTFSSSGGVSINAGATVISYTVTAGKTLYITDIDISADNVSAILVQLKAGGVVIGEKYISTTAAWEMVGIESQMTVGSGIALTLVFPTVAGKNGAYVVTGFEA